jgi:DNA-binding MarR family transcriptional regulator
MTRKRLPIAEEPSEPLAARIAAGLHKIGLAMKQQTWQQASGEGLSATQGQILAVLVEAGPLTGTELGERLGLTLPTISESVRVLVDKGFASKSPDPRHPRASLITPTRKGAALGARARSWPEFMAEAVTSLAPEEQRAFYSGVLKMIRTLQAQGLVPLSGMCVTCSHFRPHAHASKAAPHHCALVDAPLAAEQLRLDCPDHQPVAEEAREQLWQAFLRPS